MPTRSATRCSNAARCRSASRTPTPAPRSEQPIFGEPGAAPRGWLVAQRRCARWSPPTATSPALLAQAAASTLGWAAPAAATASSRYPRPTGCARTQSQFEPIRISARLWIVPSWHDAPDPAAINIVLDPGLAFGTGSHPTTRLCLQWLEANVRGGESVLDYGCGSGILAIAAAKLGAGDVIGIDIDPDALRAARDNAARTRQVRGSPAPTRRRRRRPISSSPTSWPVR